MNIAEEACLILDFTIYTDPKTQHILEQNKQLKKQVLEDLKYLEGDLRFRNAHDREIKKVKRIKTNVTILFGEKE